MADDNDTRTFKLEWAGGMPFYRSDRGYAVGPWNQDWHSFGDFTGSVEHSAETGFTLAWFEYKDGGRQIDWRFLTVDQRGKQGVEYATKIVFKRRNAAGEKSRGIA